MKSHPAPEDRGGEAREVADHAAAERQDMIAPLDTEAKQPVDRGGELRPALGLFAGGKDPPVRFVAMVPQRGFKHLAPCCMDMDVGDHGDVALAEPAATVWDQIR